MSRLDFDWSASIASDRIQTRPQGRDTWVYTWLWIQREQEWKSFGQYAPALDANANLARRECYPLDVQLTFDIPDDLASQLLASGREPSRVALETLTVEGYRMGRLSEGQIREILGYSTRMEVHALLAEHEVSLHYTPADLEVDSETSRFIRSLRAQELARPCK